MCSDIMCFFRFASVTLGGWSAQQYRPHGVLQTVLRLGDTLFSRHLMSSQLSPKISSTGWQY